MAFDVGVRDAYLSGVRMQDQPFTAYVLGVLATVLLGYSIYTVRRP